MTRTNERKLDKSNVTGQVHFPGVRLQFCLEIDLRYAIEERSSAEFVELGVMGQWCHWLEDRREACSSMLSRSWW